MPAIDKFQCRACGLKFPTGWGGFVYAVDSKGKRVVCPHPAEFTVIKEVTGMSYWEAKAAQRVGFNSDCICLDCLAQFKLDLNRDSRVCPKCESQKIRSIRELIDQPCPKCKKGKIEKISTGLMS